jgi:leucine dehydrogenase
LIERGILFVPDVVASGGAVIEGIGRTVMQLADRTPLIDALGTTAHQILEEARASGARPTAIAQQRARARIATRRG